MANTKDKAKRGRPPKQKVFTPQELKEESVKQRRAAQKRRIDEMDIDVPALCDEVDGISYRNRLTKEEIDELKRKVYLIYEHYVLERWEEEAALRKDVDDRIEKALAETEASRPGLDKPMSREEWNEIHRLRPDGKRKPGPQPKRKKNIFEVPTDKFGEPLEALTEEQIVEFEQQYLSEKYAEHRQEEGQFLKGKRVRRQPQHVRSRRPTKNFWM
jgi:hypothetical protein